MPVPLIAGLPPDLDLPDGYHVQFNALSPVDGSAITGVIVENVSIFGTNLGGAGVAGVDYKPVLLRAQGSSG